MKFKAEIHPFGVAQIFFLLILGWPGAGVVAAGVPAFLPKAEDVPLAETLPIDGVWLVNTIGKRIRIEGGRAYVIDPWVHAFVLKVDAGMVVLRGLERVGPGEYVGYDLPLLGNLNAEMRDDGALDVSVSGALGPASYKLIPVEMDDQEGFDLEKAGYYDEPAAAGAGPEAGQADVNRPGGAD